MLHHPGLNILCVCSDTNNLLASFIGYLHQMPHVCLMTRKDIPEDLEPFHAVITESAYRYSPVPSRLKGFVHSGGLWLSLIGLSEKPVDSLFGVQPGRIGPESELRVLFQERYGCIADRLADAFFISGIYQGLSVQSEDVKTLLVADWHFQHTPLLTYRAVDAGHVVCTTIQDFNNRFIRQILYRLIRQFSAVPPPAGNLSVGILGYAPSVGELHGKGIEASTGLTLKAICDLNPTQLQLAANVFPDAALYASADAMAQDSSIEVVIVATPPNTHAAISVQLMAAGKHVVCEKPLAINCRETDSMAEMAELMGVHLSCHQNRRFDQDFQAIRQAVFEGLIGELFYMESFVGGFHHPCGHWHSHTPVSGGTAYDWGAHYLDWIVGLIPEKVDYVSGTSQKRVWHDVTNADHEQIRVRFQNKAEAVFIHSDIAAIRKPKWYLLGTKGAIVGHWQDVTSYDMEPLLYYERHDIPATEMPPDLRLTVRHSGGKLVEQKMALPERQKYPFHQNIADHLLLGEPLGAPLADSVKVVSILEAASISAANGGIPEQVK